tara:strand:+ start:170 stop:892 length:723 start_codon:yes stop_codon:yes gene_type:complete
MSVNKNSYSITNNDNYKQSINYNVENILEKYLSIFTEYFNHLEECNFNIYNQYYKYIIINGVNCINNIFKILLLYTNNIELVLYHTQKSFIYYIEFITQIGDENNNFLQLNSKDATLFVYKKTIFEINNDIRKDFSIKKDNREILDNINNYILLSKKIIDDFININDENIYKNIQNKILPILKKLIEVLFINNIDIDLQYKIEIVEIILNKHNNNSENFIVNLQSIIKKIKRKNFMINVN